jgi:DNA topoisomerase-1
LKAHGNELDPKFQYFLSAPEADPDGNPAIVKFRRKTKEQYLASEHDGKATGWTATYENGAWVETAKPAKQTKRAAAPRKRKKARG